MYLQYNNIYSIQENMMDLSNRNNQYISFTDNQKDENDKFNTYVLISLKNIHYKNLVELYKVIESKKLDILLPTTTKEQQQIDIEACNDLSNEDCIKYKYNELFKNIDAINYETYIGEPLFMIHEKYISILTDNNILSGKIESGLKKDKTPYAYLIPFASHISTTIEDGTTPGLEGAHLINQRNLIFTFDNYNVLKLNDLSISDIATIDSMKHLYINHITDLNTSLQTNISEESMGIPIYYITSIPVYTNSIKLALNII